MRILYAKLTSVLEERYELRSRVEHRARRKWLVGSKTLLGTLFPFFLLAGELVDGFRTRLRLRKLRPPSRCRSTRKGVG